MWIFTRYGFYSVACASKPDGSLDKETVMVRGRSKDHLHNLRNRFTAIAATEIVTMADRDYHYRIILAKSVWAPILAQLAEEQEWSNFKSEAAAYQSAEGTSYLSALHDVWGIMYRLQNSRDSREHSRL
jgi:hypothetical protein